MAYNGVQYTITATAVSLTTALGLSKTLRARQIDIRNASGALNPLYLGKLTVTNVPANAFAQLAAGESWSDVAPETGAVNTDEIFLVGTANAANIAFITVID